MSFFKMKCLSFFLFITIFSLERCSKNTETPTGPDHNASDYLWVHFMQDSVKMTFDEMAKITVDGEQAIQLSEFIDTSAVSIPGFSDKNDNMLETRVLYTFQIVGDDGFSASVKGYANNTWEQMKLGHILTGTRLVVFPDDKIDLPGAYNVKDTKHIFIFRKFDVLTPDTTAFIELNSMAKVPVIDSDGNTEEAIPLQDFVLQLVSTPDIYLYNVESLDGYVLPGDLSWEKFQTGYWLLASEKTMFTDSTLSSGKYKVKAVDKIVVK